MAKLEVLIFSARGEASFTEEQRLRLMNAAQITFHPAPKKVPVEDFIHLAQKAEIIGLTPRAAPVLDGDILNQLENLKAVALPTTGVEWIDLSAFREKNLIVTNVPNFSTVSTAEFTVGLILSVSRKLESAFQGKSKVGFDLAGKTIGLVGFGAIGKEVARLLAAFRMRILFYDPQVLDGDGLARKMDFDELLAESDLVSLHCPLNASTREFFNREKLGRLKRHCHLINTARPQLVHLESVLSGLDSGQIAGYAFDQGYLSSQVIEPFRNHPKAIVVPHMSWYTEESIAREIEMWVQEILNLIDGQPKHRIL